jgi:hypothetical protein
MGNPEKLATYGTQDEKNPKNQKPFLQRKPLELYPINGSENQRDKPDTLAALGTQSTRHKTKTDQTKYRQNICWAPLYVNKHK